MLALIRVLALLLAAQGLVGNWLLNDGTGLTAVDRSPNKHQATVKGCNWKVRFEA